jgi:spore cortex formation protein SpoVR/YcgB (stage V sporulation)/intein/homing endonuclease
MSTDDRIRKQRVADDLAEPAREARRLAEKLGLAPFDVNYWVVDYDEMNELVAYGGFQHRYPHWRWGMAYDRQRKQTQFLGGKAFEIVNNDDPAHAFLQESNDLADQKAVITHVEAHADFFRNNEWFRLFGTSPDAAAMLERHGETVAEYMADPEVSREDVEAWIDHVLCLEDNIDQHREFATARASDEESVTPGDLAEELEGMDVSEEVRTEVFDEEFLEAMTDDGEGPTFPPAPETDLLAFLVAHGKAYDEEAGKATDYEEWQREILEVLRTEAYYFAPQKMTKVMNEGWACVDPDTPVFTEAGLVPMREVVDRHLTVSDGDEPREVYDSTVIDDHDTVTIETRRGYELTGSNNHRVRRPGGDWVRLDELSVGDEIAVSGGNGTWPEEYVQLDWSNPTGKTLHDVADEAGVSMSTVLRYRRTGRARNADEIEAALADYEGLALSTSKRDEILVPTEVREQLARFLGLLVGDGHVPSNSCHVGFTSGRREHAEEVAGLIDELFHVDATVSEQGSRWRVHAYSENLREFLIDEVGLPDGESAADKTVPRSIRRSPKSVVAEFIRGLFDADGYAGEQGAILSTKSEDLGRTVQMLLTNFGILSRRRSQHDGCYHLHLTGESASTFADEIGFGYPTKAAALAEYLDGLAWFEAESWTDEVADIEEGTGTVHDISVEETHRYAAAGFLNHNSYHESLMMADERFAGPDEFLSYADHMAQVLGSPGLNPYKLGFELWQYIENRRNRREVVEHLLRVEGVTWRNFADTVDLEAVMARLEPDPEMADPAASLDALEADDPRVDEDALSAARRGAPDDGGIDVERYPWKLLTYEGLAERHYSLSKPQHRGFLKRISQAELEKISRYLFETDRYDDVAAAVAAVDRTAGWDRMREVRESHNDVTFLDAFLTPEFVDENDYFTYEYTRTTGDFRVTSEEAEDVKKKLMLQFTNFGKPTIAVKDGNFRNRNELLLVHQYNGVQLDLTRAKQTLERVFELWGRPVALKTVRKELDDHDIEVARRRDTEPEPTEQGTLIRFDGESFEETDLPDEEIEEIVATDVDYDTKPDEWL